MEMTATNQGRRNPLAPVDLYSRSSRQRDYSNPPSWPSLMAKIQKDDQDFWSQKEKEAEIGLQDVPTEVDDRDERVRKSPENLKAGAQTFENINK